MRPNGYAVSEAATLAAARGKLPSFKPHVIVLNLSGDLEQALAFIAEQEATTPTVVLTSSRVSEVMQAALRAGARDVLVRPFKVERLTEAIERALSVGKVRQERDLLREQTERQAQEFNALYTVGQKIAALLDLEEVLTMVVSAAVSLTGAEEGALMLLDVNTGELYLRASLNLSESAARRTRVKVTDTLMGRVVQSGRPIMMSGNDLVRIQTAFLVKAILCVPLIFGERVTGVLNVDNKLSGRQFSEHDVHLLSTLADSAAIAIENAQLYAEARRRANELAALIEIDRHISSTLDLTVVLQRIAKHAHDLLKADDSEVYLLEPDGQQLRAIVAIGQFADEIKAHPLRLGEGIVGAVAQSGAAEMVSDAEKDPRSAQIPGTPTEREALLCAPLISKGHTLGVMTVVRTGDHPPFEASEFAFFKGLAGQAAIAIENARMYVSEHQRALELVRILEQQRELDRLKNEFIQNISHELRTPLAIVRGYAELLDGGELGELPPEQRESVSIMARRSRMLSKMLDDLLAILAAETGKIAHDPIDMVKLVSSLVAEFQPAAKQAGLSITSNIVLPIPGIIGDQVHLRRVLDNLLSNALKFTQAGGRIAVRLCVEDRYVVLEVTDTGIGIPPDKLDRIFDRFYQVDGSATRRYGGVGLGLALVREIAESHGGYVDVQSTVGKGSTFRVCLPAAAEAED
jgi:signal transduction histidine kinase/DNA-binding response OmpR family regulator/putative methionine-R-sulfoxide reductase with GAF domain